MKRWKRINYYQDESDLPYRDAVTVNDVSYYVQGDISREEIQMIRPFDALYENERDFVNCLLGEKEK